MKSPQMASAMVLPLKIRQRKRARYIDAKLVRGLQGYTRNCCSCLGSSFCPPALRMPNQTRRL